MTPGRRWGRRKITPVKAQRALDAIMALVQTSDWADVDHDTRRTIDDACREITRLRDATTTR